MNTKISNYYPYSEKLAAGGQPTAEQIGQLKKDGFEAIINISPASARNALVDEHAIVESLKMDYVHFPIDCSNLQTFHYTTICALLNSLEEKKTFIHCGANIKTSNFIHMYSVLENKVEESVSLKTLLSIQQPEEKWFKYFRQMGMMGLTVI